jgi:hypothetical protein
MSPRNASTPAKPDKTSGKAPAAKGSATKSRTPRPRAKTAGIVAPEDRLRYIAEAAYFKAEQRGFAGGSELGDWVEAEAEIDALLNSRGAG